MSYRVPARTRARLLPAEHHTSQPEKKTWHEEVHARASCVLGRAPALAASRILEDSNAFERHDRRAASSAQCNKSSHCPAVLGAFEVVMPSLPALLPSFCNSTSSKPFNGGYSDWKVCLTTSVTPYCFCDDLLQRVTRPLDRRLADSPRSSHPHPKFSRVSRDRVLPGWSPGTENRSPQI